MLTRQQRRARARQKAKQSAQRKYSKLQAGIRWLTQCLLATIGLLRPVWTTVSRLPWWADIAGLVTFAYFGWELFAATVPYVQPDRTGSLSEYPFTVENKSLVLTMHIKSFRCDPSILNYEATSDSTMQMSFSVAAMKEADWDIVVAPGQSRTFTCPIEKRTTGETLRLGPDPDNGPIVPTRHVSTVFVPRVVFETDFWLWRWKRRLAAPRFVVNFPVNGQPYWSQDTPIETE